MKNLYTVIFTSNNANSEENFALEMSQLEKEERLIKKTLDQLVFSPSQKVLDNILNFAKNSK